MEQRTDFPPGEVFEAGQRPPALLERWSVWIGLTVVLTLIAYTVPVMDMIRQAPPGSMGIRSW
jgi:cytochrome c oxidase subunit 1